MKSCYARAAALAGLFPFGVMAAGLPTDTPITLDVISVTGEDADLTGEPRTATEGLVLTEQIEQRPVSRPAELLEFVPGLIATQHSGEGKANQYFLRGFNLDHGTDFAIEVEGMPVNMRSHAHGQGYADLNFLLPELVDALEYRKGIAYAEVGDFSAAGSAEFSYLEMLPPTIEVTLGEYDYYRTFAGGSTMLGGGELLAAGAFTRYDGPWELEQDLRKTNAVLKYSRSDARRDWSVTAMAYDNEWNATDQIPQRAVESGRIGRFGTIDPTDGGESHRYSLSFKWLQRADEAEWRVSGYAIDYYLDLFSNFTYFLEDPVRGDQFEQLDERRIYGLEGAYVFPLELAAQESRLTLGVQTRYDDIAKVGLYRTDDRERFSTIREDSIDEISIGLYSELAQRWSPHVRSVLGLRLDHYRFDVEANQPANSGEVNDTLLSPKLSLIFGPWHKTEYFFSIGGGFHSNDARGVTIAVDPVTGEPVDAVDPLVKAWAVDLGLRSAILPNTQLALSVFALRLDSELVYVGDAGGTEASGESERYGLELGVFYTPWEWLIIDGDLAFTHARFTDAGEANYIPNAVSRVASLGFTVDGFGGWSGGLRLRHFGPAPLVEDNSVRSDGTTLLNGRIGYDLNPGWTVALTGFNLLDSDENDITYYYASRLPGEPAEGVEDVHFHPVEPRNFRVSLRKVF
jgi:outer membrane receptor protein involved in Fe transport